MDFILNQQAQLAVKVDAIAEAQQRAEERWVRADNRWVQTEASIRALLAIAELHERDIKAQGEQIAATREAGRETDERLNALIDMVERYLSKRGNGDTQNGDA